MNITTYVCVLTHSYSFMRTASETRTCNSILFGEGAEGARASSQLRAKRAHVRMVIPFAIFYNFKGEGAEGARASTQLRAKRAHVRMVIPFAILYNFKGEGAEVARASSQLRTKRAHVSIPHFKRITA